MMEVEAARVMWSRSVARHKLRYTIVLSDGDAKAFQELSKIKPYGAEITIQKQECINHVSKRLGTALRTVVADCRKRGITLGGRGRGQLTQNTVRKLTIYYSRAIRGNTTVPEMEKAVMASLHHCYSTDDNPTHQLCPPGVDSWCFYQVALSQGQIPGPHEKLVKTPLNKEKLHAHLLPVYERLSDEQLLKRCAAGKTQNSNESLHNSVWARCPKEKFAQRRRVHFAVVTAAREFNFGPSAAQDTARFYGFSTGCHMKRLGAARMAKRVRNSVKEKADKQGKRRATVRAAKLKRMAEVVSLEGGPGYATGQF